MAAKYPGDGFTSKGCCCCICFDKFKDPRTLACLHTFCQECINQYIMKNHKEVRKNGISCPMCRKVTHIDLKETPIKLLAKSLPVNYALEEALVTIQGLEKTSRCMQCSKCTPEKLLCLRCATVIQAQHQKPTQSNCKSLGHKEVSRCALHNKKYKFYCFDEDILACSKCCFKYHRKCEKVDELCDISENRREECAEALKNQICTLKRKAKNVRQFLTVNGYKMEQAHEKIALALQDAVQKPTELLNAQKVLGSLIKDHLSKYQLQIGKCSSLVDVLDNVDQMLIGASQTRSTEQAFISLLELKPFIFKYSGQFQEVSSDLTYTEMSFKIETSPKGTTGSPYKLKTRREIVNINNLSDYRIVSLHTTFTRMLSKAVNEKEQPLISGVEFLSDRRLAVCDNKNWKCVIFDTMLQKLGEIKLSNFVYDIGTTKGEDIFITGVNTIESLRFDQDNCFTKPISTKILSRADSLAVCDENSFIIGTFNSTVPVCKVSKDGKENGLDLEFPSKQWKLGKSKCAYDVDKKNLVVTDRSCNTLYICNLNDGTKVTVSDHRLKEPSGVAFGPAGCVFVCCEDTNSLVQITVAGEIVYSHKLDMISPCTLVFSKERGKLAVSNNNKERKLQILDVVFFSQE